MRITHVGYIRSNPLFIVCEVESIAAIFGYQGIDYSNPGAHIAQSARQIGADEAESPGYEHSLAGKFAVYIIFQVLFLATGSTPATGLRFPNCTLIKTFRANEMSLTLATL